MNQSPSQRIKELGLDLPPSPPPAGVYRPVLVVNGFSELMAEVFGTDLGVRSAVGIMLPDNIPVEVEAVFRLKQ